MRPARNPNYVTFGPKETIVTFATARGELRTNDSGEFFYRNFTDGKFTCASPDLERQLVRAGVRPGVPVGITRTTYNRVAIWKVRLIGQVIQMPEPEVPANSASQPTANGLPERVYAKPEPPAPVFPECDAIAATPPLVAAPPASSGPSDGGLLGRCLIEALDACKAAQAHAAAIGLPTVFGAGEVERMGVSIFIERTRYGSVVDRKPNGRAVDRMPNGASDQGAYHA
jgi:hypothetical protein